LKKEERFYIKNEDFLKELEKYKETKIVSDELGKIFLKLAKKLANRSNFCRYSYREDMIYSGVQTCIRYVDKFDPSKSKNPFSYFTKTIWRAFITYIKNEKKQIYIKERLIQEMNQGSSKTSAKRVRFNENFI